MWWTAEGKIKNSDSDTWEVTYSGYWWQDKTQTWEENPYACYISTLTDSDMSGSDFITHEIEEFTESDDREDGVNCTTQPLEPNDFAKLNSTTQGEIFYWAEPRNWVWYFSHQVSAVSIHMLDGFFQRDWRHSCNKSPRYCFEVTVTSGFMKQSLNSHYYVNVNLSCYNSNYGWYFCSWVYTFLQFEVKCRKMFYRWCLVQDRMTNMFGGM